MFLEFFWYARLFAWHGFYFLRIFLCMWVQCIHMRGFLNLFFLIDIM